MVCGSWGFSASSEFCPKWLKIGNNKKNWRLQSTYINMFNKPQTTNINKHQQTSRSCGHPSTIPLTHGIPRLPHHQGTPLRPWRRGSEPGLREDQCQDASRCSFFERCFSADACESYVKAMWKLCESYVNMRTSLISKTWRSSCLNFSWRNHEPQPCEAVAVCQFN